MQSQYSVSTPAQNDSGKWLIYADDQGTVVGEYESADDARGHLCDLGLSMIAVETNLTGLGSTVEIPIDWIGDGQKLIGSQRVLDLICPPTRNP